MWCPSNSAEESVESIAPRNRGEWVRPTIPFVESTPAFDNGKSDDHAYVIAMAGEFLQLTSNGEVPVCIHRVIPPRPQVIHTYDMNGQQSTAEVEEYKPRVSSPMFLRPRRGKDATLDVSEDLKLVDSYQDSNPQSISNNVNGEEALYFEEGLIEECDEMHLWSAHDIMMRK